jgi:acetyl esterase
MSNDAAALAGDAVDPEIRAFLDRMGELAAAFPPLDSLSLPEARKIAEKIREPWRQGGPAMAKTRELAVATAHGAVRVRIYTPEGAADPGAALVYLHGGGWTLFSIDTHDRLMREYADAAGVVVVGVDYSLSPEAKFPRALEEVVSVVGWLQEHGGEFGIDPRRLAVGGDSAGGNLSMAAAIKLRDAGHGGLIKGLLLNYGAFALGCSARMAELYGGEGFMLGDAEMDQFWVNYLADPATDADNPLACPAVARLDGLPPAFLVIAECDILAEQNEAMLDRLVQAGVAASGVVYSGATHSFLEAMSISPLARRAIQDSAAWLRDVLRP